MSTIPNTRTSCVVGQPRLFWCEVCKTISPLGNSDHTGIALLVETGRETINRQSGSREIWQYIYADFGRANDLINATNWDGILCDDVNVSVEHWHEQYLAIMHWHIPMKTLSKRHFPPWLSGSIIRHIRK